MMGPILRGNRGRMNVLKKLLVSGLIGSCFLVDFLGTGFWAAKVPSKTPPKTGQVTASKKICTSCVPWADVEKRLKPAYTEITQRQQAMADRFNYGKAVDTLKAAFQQKGVSIPADGGYTGPWGNNGLYLTWDVTRHFYGHHQNALERSLGIAKQQGYMSAEDLATLETGIRAWRADEPEIPRLFAIEVDQMATRGLLLNYRNEALKKSAAVGAEKAAAQFFTPEQEARYLAFEKEAKIFGEEADKVHDSLCVTDEKIRKYGSVRHFNAIDEDVTRHIELD